VTITKNFFGKKRLQRGISTTKYKNVLCNHNGKNSMVPSKEAMDIEGARVETPSEDKIFITDHKSVRIE
jgi:hypothetical protein